MPILLPLLCSVLLGACASPDVVTRVEYVRQEIPAELLTCYDAPAAPADGATLREVTLYALDLDAAGQDCRDKLRAVRATAGKDAARAGR